MPVVRLPRLVAEREDEQEVLDRLYAEEDEQRQRYLRKQTTPPVSDADDAWAIEALDALGIPREDEPEETVADPEFAEAVAPESEREPHGSHDAQAGANPASLYGSLLGIRRAHDVQPASDDPGSEFADQRPDLSDIGAPGAPAMHPEAFDEEIIEAEHEDECDAKFGSLVAAIGEPKKALSSEVDEPRAPPRFAQPAPRSYDFDPTAYSADFEPAVENRGRGARARRRCRARRLARGRAETAEAAKAGEGRTRAALYDALSLGL